MLNFICFEVVNWNNVKKLWVYLYNDPVNILLKFPQTYKLQGQRDFQGTKKSEQTLAKSF